MSKGQFLMPSSPCTACGKVFDGATSIDEHQDAPRPGDITICVQCGHIMAFGDDLKLRDLNAEEAHDVAGSPLIVRAVNALHHIKKQ